MSVVKLIAKTPCADLLPFSWGGVSLIEQVIDQMHLVEPVNGTSAAGLTLPRIGRSNGGKDARILWFGQGHWMVHGPAPRPADAAVTDQSDAWACVTIVGATAPDVLSRLVPADITPLKRGDVIRTQIQHMNGAVHCTGDNSFDLYVFRSMAGTLVHELKTAMRGVAAREGLSTL